MKIIAPRLELKQSLWRRTRWSFLHEQALETQVVEKRVEKYIVIEVASSDSVSFLSAEVGVRCRRDSDD